MYNLISYFFLGIFFLTTSPAKPQQDPEAEATHTIYVSSISWHTGIVVPVYALPDSLWPKEHTYPEDSYLEIGWGDADFYPHDGGNIWYGIKAAFWPTSSVLHVNPIYEDVGAYYFDTEVVRIEVSDEQLHRLSLFLIDELALNENGRAVLAAPGLYANSYFYKGSSSYYFPNNSNVWAARALNRAGFSITPIWYQTTGWVLNKAENFGERVVEER